MFMFSRWTTWWRQPCWYKTLHSWISSSSDFNYMPGEMLWERRADIAFAHREQTMHNPTKTTHKHQLLHRVFCVSIYITTILKLPRVCKVPKKPQPQREKPRGGYIQPNKIPSTSILLPPSTPPPPSLVFPLKSVQRVKSFPPAVYILNKRRGAKESLFHM